MRANVLAVAALLTVWGELSAQVSYPMITHTHPVAVQRGKSSVVSVEGQQDFDGAYKILVEGDDWSGKPVGVEDSSRRTGRFRGVQVEFTVAPRAMPGVREFRVATRTGLSSIGQVVIVEEPVVVESGNNNTLATAQSVSVPVVVCGRIEASEDVDCFRFRAEQGQVCTFEVFAARLQDKIHDLQEHVDPILVLYDDKGRELASADDVRFADPFLAYRFERTGDYCIQVRDARYQGDARWVYALRITNKPHATHVYPLALRAGAEEEVELVGVAVPAGQRAARLRVPADAPGGFCQVAPVLQGETLYPVTAVVTDLPSRCEAEPNDRPEQAPEVNWPVCINGRIAPAGDVDCFRFRAHKGQRVRVEVFARRFGTGLVGTLDGQLEILDEKGRVLASADDQSPAIKDPGLTFEAAADGVYTARVRDLLGKGGESAVYALEIRRADPDFALRCDGDKAMIPRGGSVAWYVQVTRLNGFDGPVEVQVRGLPKGVTASPLTLPPGVSQGVVVLSAASDAPVDACHVHVVGVARLVGQGGTSRTLERPAAAMQEIYLPGGGRGRFEVRLHSVAVTEAPDIEQVAVEPTSVSLQPGQSVTLKVTIKRRSDFRGNVTLDVKLRHLGTVYGDCLPPGVVMDDGQSRTLLGQGNEGTIVLRALPGAAPVEHMPISVVAYVSVNFVVKIGYSSPPIRLTVRSNARAQ